MKRSCLQGVVFDGDQASFWQLLGEFSGVQLEDFATLRGGFEDLGRNLGHFMRRFEDQPGEIGNFLGDFGELLEKSTTLRGIFGKAGRGSTQRVDTDLRNCRPGRGKEAVHLGGGGPGAR